MNKNVRWFFFRGRTKLFNYFSSASRFFPPSLTLPRFMRVHRQGEKDEKLFSCKILINSWNLKINIKSCSCSNIYTVPPMLWVSLSVIYFCIICLRQRGSFMLIYVFPLKHHPQIPHQLVGVPLGFNITLECFTEAHPTSLNYWTREDGHMIHDNKKYR